MSPQLALGFLQRQPAPQPDELMEEERRQLFKAAKSENMKGTSYICLCACA